MKRSILFLTLSQFILFNCTLDFPKDPKAPKWDVEIEKIPLLKADTLRLGDQLDPKDYKRNGADSIISISINKETQLDLKDKLKTPAQYKEFSDQLGNIVANVTQSSESEFKFADLYPDLAQVPGSTAEVPAIDLVPSEKDVKLIDFASISVVTGGVMLEVNNRLGFALDGTVKLDLFDKGHGNVLIETINLPRIENGASATHFVDLSGKIISNQLTIRLYGRLAGSNGQQVFIPPESGINLKVTPQSIIVNQATAKLHVQEIDLSGSIDINLDTLRIRQAKIESGKIILRITNDFQYNIELKISLPNVLSVSGEPMATAISILSQQQSETSFDLKNTTIDLESQELEIKAKMTIYPDADQMYTISSNDELVIQVDISEIWFESITGDFDLQTTFPKIDEEIFKDTPDQLNNLGFFDVIVKLSFINSPFDLNLNLSITGINGDQKKQLIINKSLGPSEQLILSKDGVNNDFSTPTIVDLINLVPQEIIIEGSVGVKGENVTFSKNDQIGVKYGIDFPLIFSTTQASFSHFDSLKIEDDMRDFLLDNSMSAGITLSIENGLPISGMLSLYVGVDSTNINSKILTMTLPTPILSNGLVTTPGNITTSVNLDKAAFTAIANANFYKFDVSIDDVAEAAITADNYLIVYDVYISGSFLFDPEGLAADENGSHN